MLVRTIRVSVAVLVLAVVSSTALPAQGWRIVTTRWRVEGPALVGITGGDPVKVLDMSEQELAEFDDELDKETEAILVDAKGERFRGDADQGMYFVGHIAGRAVTMVNEAEGWGVKLTSESARQLQQMMPGGMPGAGGQQQGADAPDVRWLGTTKVNGVGCRTGEVTQGENVTRACITKEFPGLVKTYKAAMELFREVMPMLAAQEVDLENRIAEAGGGMPIAVHTLEKQGMMPLFAYERESMEIIRQAVADTLFQVADNIQMLTMQEFIQRMMSGMGR